jgi:hypothetical protein
MPKRVIKGLKAIKKILPGGLSVTYFTNKKPKNKNRARK